MKKVLIIEDNKAVRDNIDEILTLADYEVICADNGKEGADKAIKELPDIIICDIMMPTLDGYGVLQILSKNSKTSGIPFIFLTAKADRVDFRKGMEMGADDYITKPFDGVELLNAVETRLKKTEFWRKEYAPDTEGVNSFLKEAKDSGSVSLADAGQETRNFKKKQSIYEQGQRPVALYFVSKGVIKTFRISDVGKELITTIFKEGDFFGYTPLLEETTYKDNAEALEDSQVMIIPKADFYNLINTDATISKKFIKLLSSNLAEKEEHLLNLAYNSVRKRVADGLLHVNEKYKKNPGDRPKLEISRENLAQVVGTATESLIRVLSDFKSEKLIELQDGKIVIINEVKLKNLVN
jgi:CRP/FNR family cyclic AMP-dependent transcriptional regulator